MPQQVVDQIETLGAKAVAVKADAATAQGCQALVDAAVDKLGGLDILVNNAGFTKPAMLHKMDESQWDAVLSIHLKAVWMMTKAAHPHFARQKYGKIINVTSVAGVVGTVGQVNYSAAKGGVISLTKSIAREMAQYNVCANVVSMGIVATDMTKKIRDDEKLQVTYTSTAYCSRDSPRWATSPRPLFFWPQAESDYITGQIICVDGGYGLT